MVFDVLYACDLGSPHMNTALKFSFCPLSQKQSHNCKVSCTLGRPQISGKHLYGGQNVSSINTNLTERIPQTGISKEQVVTGQRRMHEGTEEGVQLHGRQC